jgi:hypothetical protein
VRMEPGAGSGEMGVAGDASRTNWGAGAMSMN